MKILEGFLREWEDLCFLMDINQKLLEAKGRSHGILKPIINGPLSHWDEFREYLNQYTPDQNFDRRRFCGWSDDVESPGFSINPPMLASWAAHSRRVFKVDQEVQKKLEVIDPGQIKISDLNWPLKSFGVSFAEPVFKNDGHSYSFALVSNYRELLFPDRDRHKLTIGFLPDWMRRYFGIRQDIRQKARNNLRSGSLDKAFRVLQKHFDRLIDRNDNGFTALRFFPDNDAEIKELITTEETSTEGGDLARKYGFTKKQLTRGHIKGVTDASQLIFNLVIFLNIIGNTDIAERLPKGEPPSESRPNQQRGGLLTDTADLFQIDNTHVINSVNRVSTPGKDSERELSPHWRRAHYRRPPGKGDDPNASKTVEVSRALVRGDKLGEEGLSTSKSKL